MLFGYLILLISVVISAIAAWYSVAGLTAIFSAAVIPVIIMGGALEAGKIVATVWLHNNWRRAGMAFKMYLIPAIVFLMLLTSMGIFGFLSKAHSDQNLVSGDALSKVAIYDEKIKTAKENIDANRKALKQMDEAVDQVMGRSADEKGADKAVAIRRAQTKERTRLLSEITAEQKLIAQLSEERAPIAAEVRKVEAEVGPIKYIAALVYGDNPDQNVLERAVRWVIILIVIVFDPLALTLILAANKQIEWARQGRGGWIHDEEDRPVTAAQDNIVVEEAPPLPPESQSEPQEHPLTEEEREAKEQQELEQFLWRGKMIAKALDAEEAERAADEANAILAELDPPEQDVDAMLEELANAKAEEQRLQAELQQQQDMLDTLATEFDALNAALTAEQKAKADIEAQLQQTEQLKTDLKAAYDASTQANQGLAQAKSQADKDLVDAGNNIARLKIDVNNKQAEIDKLNSWVSQLQNDLQAAITVAEERNRRVNELVGMLPPPPQVLVEEVTEPQVEQTPEAEVVAVEEIAPKVDSGPEQPAYDPKLGFEEKYFKKTAVADNVPASTEGNAGFGSAFPTNPQKSDVFLRIDYLPSRLYKYNGSKWIEIDKNSNDRLVYNQAYIEHLIEKIRNGEYDVDDLNDAERNEINQYLSDNDTKL